MTEQAPQRPPSAAPAPRARETQKQTERGILVWLCFFLFVTHIIGGVFWLAFHYLGES